MQCEIGYHAVAKKKEGGGGVANKGAVKLRIDMLRRRRLSAGATQLGLLGLACRGVSTVLLLLLLLLRKESLSASTK